MKEDLHELLRKENALKHFIGEHPKFLNLVEKLKMVANREVAVLLIGETGTGKGHCAEFVHQYSSRYNCPFITYNCGVGPSLLFESEFFGHVKGAFTGADCDHKGVVYEADKGVLFLDEINSLSLSSQVKLNHFLETGCFRRVGESAFRHVEVRIISASNVDLKKEIRAGHFREDLYYRLAEYELQVPALRERQQDIVILANYFLQKNGSLSKQKNLKFGESAIGYLLEYQWPGNVRELENFVKRCIIDASDEVIEFSGKIRKKSEHEILLHLESLAQLPWKEAKCKVSQLSSKII